MAGWCDPLSYFMREMRNLANFGEERTGLLQNFFLLLSVSLPNEKIFKN